MTRRRAESADGAACGTVTVTTGDRVIRAERYAVERAGEIARVGVLVLGGCQSDHAEPVWERHVATSLATAGAIALVVDYLGASTLPEGTFCVPTDTAVAGLPAVVGAVVDAAAFLRSDPAIGEGRVGAVGYSFGGLAALYASSGIGPLGGLPQTALASVGLFAAPVYPEVLECARRGLLPPLFIVHGSADRSIAVAGSEALAAATAEGATPVTLVPVRGMDHSWCGTRRKQLAARDRTVPLVVDFLVEQLASGS